MLATGQSEKTVVARLRVRGPGLDPTIARLRLASLLQSVRLRPLSLPPSAILVIKQIRDPLPGQLSLHQSGLLRPPPRWERAVGELLEQLARRAARPVLGHVDETAEAVVFLDLSELLACLASDWCRFGTLNRWWWRSLFKDQDQGQATLRAWLEASAYVPAALTHLAKRGEAVAFLCALKEADSRLMFRSIIRSFALREIETALDTLREMSNAATTLTTFDSDEGRAETATLQYGPKGSSFNARPRPPWSKIVPEAEGSGLKPDAECLLGTSLMLQRAPAPVRSREFARALFSWRLAATRTGPAHSSNSGETKTANGLSEDEREPRQRALITHSLNRKALADFKVESLSDDRDKTSGASPAATPSEAHQTDSLKGAANPLESPPSRTLSMGPPEPFLTAQELEERQYETEFGGLFYLINLALFLGLYGDFSSPAETAPPLSIWDFVALVGKELLGEKLEDDAVWPLLAVFAGRTEAQPPGHDFAAPESWRMPADWLLPFAEKSSWRWEAGGGRLRVRHAKGFCVLDVPLASDEPAAQALQRELKEHRAAAEFELLPAASSALSEAPETKALSRWLGWLVPYVRARLEQALGPQSAEDLPRVLCEHHARITCTATHLDIFMSLAQLPVAIRLSGLDRDPGWVPSAGKFIAFHFE